MILENILNKVNKEISNYFNYVKEIYEYKEIGLEEYKSSSLLCDILENNKFTVKRNLILDTAFKAIYDSKLKGPNIGLLCEYDALPSIGHGCGHNLIGVISIFTGILAKKLVDEYGGKITIIGTPAEENFGGKIILNDNHLFDDLDICLMFHPDSKNGLGGKTSALIPVAYEFYGKSAHGTNPYNGASALDAAVISYQNINMLRQFAKPESFIHGIIKNGGDAANIIPEYSRLEYYFRANTLEYAYEIKDKADNIVKNIAAANNCEVKTTIYEAIYGDKLINYELAKLLAKSFEDENIFDYAKVDELPKGSSDIGCVSYKVPTIEGNIKICNDDILCHSLEFALKTISQEGFNALKLGTKVLIRLINYILIDESYLIKIKEEFERNKK